MALNIPRWQTITLSRGKVYSNVWQAVKDDFPSNSEVHLNFFDSNGNVIATAEGEVTARTLLMKVEPPTFDDVPRGAPYELVVITDDGPYLFEYGNVARREASFYNPGPSLVEPNQSRLFIDKLNRNSIGRKWKPIWGGVAMHQFGDDSWGMGSNTGLLFAESAVRYYRPLGGDSFRVRFQCYAVPGSAIGTGGSGKMQFLAGMDITSHMGFALEIEHGLTNRRVKTGIVTAPTDIDVTGQVNTNTDMDTYYTVDYSDLDHLYQVYKDDDLVTPIITWEDQEQELPKGPGFRYFGFAWDSSLTATGPLLRGIEIQDRV